MTTPNNETVPLPKLDTYDLNRLDRACELIHKAFGEPPYQVGSSLEKADYRDVDVRTILSDDEFDAMFQGRRELWEAICLTFTAYLREMTGLRIDYQIQRMTEAQQYRGSRNPLGMGRIFAGGGDATRFEDSA